MQALGVTWQPSPLHKGRYITQLMVGGVDLCVEIGANADARPLLLITGLGSQMTFWENSLIDSLTQKGFFVIRFDNRDTGLSAKFAQKKARTFSHLMPLEQKRKATQRRLLKHRLKKRLGSRFVHYTTKTRQSIWMLKMRLGIQNHNINPPYTLECLAHDALGIIRTLGLQDVHLAGASMGGMVALIAASKSRLVSHLSILFSTTNGAFLPPPAPRAFYTFIKKPKSNDPKDVMRHAVFFMKAVSSPAHIEVGSYYRYTKARLNRSQEIGGFNRQLHAIFATGDLTHLCKGLDIPVLVMHGNKDTLLPPMHGRAIARACPKSRFVLIDGMGHDIPPYYHDFIASMMSQNDALDRL